VCQTDSHMADRHRPIKRRSNWREQPLTILVLAVLASFLFVQTAAALSDHPDHEGPNDHCCAACHGGHYPVLQTQTFVHIAQLTLAQWHEAVDDARPASHEWTTVNSSRAPPA